MSDKHSHVDKNNHHFKIGGVKSLDENVEFKPSEILTGLLEKDNHFSLPGPTLKPKLNIKPIHPKTNHFLNQAKNNKKSNLWFKISLFLLLLSIVFVAFAGLNLYAQAKSTDQNKNIEKCTNAVNLANQKGIEIDSAKCQAATGWYNLFGQDLSSQNYFKTMDEIASKQNELEDKINVIDIKIALNKNQLVFLRSNFDDIPAVVKNDNLSTYLSLLQNQQKALESLVNNNISKIELNLELAKKILPKIPSVSQTDKDFVNNYSNLRPEKQIENYPKLEDLNSKFKLLLESFEAKSTYPIVGSLSDYKFFTAKDFQDLYDNFIYSNVQEAQPIVNITDNVSVDNYIRNIAERRGYKKRVQAINTSLVNVDGYRLQLQAAADWKAVKAAALKDRVSLGLVSGFRSYDEQRGIFVPNFRQEAFKKVNKDYTSSDVTSGLLDQSINNVLNTISIPGYSKHHTGYAIDVTDVTSGKSFTRFEETAGYTWLSENNFYNAKRFGFIPSCPKGENNFGPNPESWEYVWVGVDILKS